MTHKIGVALIAFQMLFMQYLSSANSILDRLNANNDHGLWLEQNVYVTQRDWRIRLNAQQRFGADYKKFYYEQYEVIFLYDISKFLAASEESFVREGSLGGGYNGSYELRKNTLGDYHWVWLNREVVESWLTMHGFFPKIVQRARGEYLTYARSHYKDHALFRYLLSFYLPWSWKKCHPYISNEWFFRSNTYHKTHPSGLVGGWYQNRLRMGFEIDWPCDGTSTNLYWQWRTRKQKPDSSPRWIHTYQIGFGINLSI